MSTNQTFRSSRQRAASSRLKRSSSGQSFRREAARVVAMKTTAVSGLARRSRARYSRMRPSGASAGSPAAMSLPPQWKTTTRGA